MATVLLINDTWVYNHSILAICKYQWSRAIKILRIYCYRINGNFIYISRISLPTNSFISSNLDTVNAD